MTHNEKENPSIETCPEITQMMGLRDTDIKTFIITMFHICKKIKQRLTMLTREREDIFLKTQINWNFKNGNYNVWDKKYTRWINGTLDMAKD